MKTARRADMSSSSASERGRLRSSCTTSAPGQVSATHVASHSQSSARDRHRPRTNRTPDNPGHVSPIQPAVSSAENEKDLSSPTLDRLIEVIRAEIQRLVFHSQQL